MGKSSILQTVSRKVVYSYIRSASDAGRIRGVPVRLTVCCTRFSITPIEFCLWQSDLILEVLQTMATSVQEARQGCNGVNLIYTIHDLAYRT